MAAQPENQSYPDMQAGMPVVSSDDQPVGTVREVFRDVGLIEAFGTTGIPPQQEGHDPVHYAYSEAMPGSGEDYLTVKSAQGVLYIPFSAVMRVEKGRTILAIDADDVPLMSWQVRPDALKSLEHEYGTDEGAEPHVA